MVTVAQARAMQAAKKKGVVQSPVAALRAQAVAQAVAQQQAAQAARKASGGAQWLADVDDDKAAKAAAKKAKPKGVLGAVLGNPVVKKALVPLQVLDTGRRAVISTAQETGDLVNGNGFSGSDWMKQTKDPSFGAGTMLAHFTGGKGTGNKWVDRGIGLAGDVAADPFTYLTLGGSDVPGLAGRAALAETAARKGAATLGEEGVNDLVSRIAKYGTHDLAPAEREMLQVADPGVRFAGKRIPGTGELANVIGKSGRTVANAIHDTPVGRGMRALSSAGRSPEVRDAIEHLATGKGEGTLAEAASTLHLRNVGKIEEKSFEGVWASKARDIDRLLKKHPDAVHEVEAGLNTEGANALRQGFKDIRGDMQAKGVKVPDFGEHYVPHIETQSMRKFMDRAKSNVVRDTLDSSSGRTAQRVWRAGDYKIAGKEVHFADDSMRTITKELQSKFPELQGKKLFEDNGGFLFAKYVQDASKDVGKARTLLTGLETTPYGVKPLDDVSTMVPTGKTTHDVNQLDVDFGTRSHEAAQGDFWKRHATVEDARVHAASSVADLAEAQGQDASGLRALASEPAPRTVKKTVAYMDDTEHKMLDAVDALPDYHDPDLAPTLGVVADYVKLKESLGPKADAVFASKDFLAAAKKGTFNEEMKTQLKEGWKAIGKDVLGSDVAVTDQLAKNLENIYRLVDTNQFWKAVDRYTQFFKAYATMTPGFHVRNAMDSTFKNGADGVTFNAIMDGPKFWQAYRGNSTGDFLSELEKKGFSREESDYVLKAVYGSGVSGQYSASELGHAQREASSFASKALDKATHNRLTETSANIGQRVEGAARAAMAMDSFRNGASIEEAVARIRRVHFDYSDVNELDRMAKRLIPFWTFMSRNIPLQVQQMWLKPNLYLKWESVKRNLGGTPDPNAIIPQSVAERNGIMLGSGMPGSWALTPDLSQNRLMSDIGTMTDPVRFLSNTNPLLRVPLELIAHRNFYNDYPLDANRLEKADKEMALLKYLGLTDQAGNGDTVVDSRIPYALRNLIPPLAVTQRATASGGSYVNGQPYNYYGDDDKQIATGLGFLGVPLTKVTAAAVTRQKQKDSKAAKPKTDAKKKALQNFGR